MFSKSELRIIQKNKRKNLDKCIISNIIIQNLFSLQEFKNAKNIFTYISFSDEIITNRILELKNKNILVPKIIKGDIIMTHYTPDNLTKNKFGIYEPIEYKIILPQKDDVIIIPALAADKNFNRLGYGAGFYDRYLRKNEGIKIILIPDELLVDQVPCNKNDIQCDIIITQKTIIKALS